MYTLYKQKTMVAAPDREAVFKPLMKQYQAEVNQELNKYKRLREMDIFVLDNSIRESTVGKNIFLITLVKDTQYL